MELCGPNISSLNLEVCGYGALWSKHFFFKSRSLWLWIKLLISHIILYFLFRASVIIVYESFHSYEMYIRNVKTEMFISS